MEFPSSLQSCLSHPWKSGKALPLPGLFPRRRHFGRAIILGRKSCAHLKSTIWLGGEEDMWDYCLANENIGFRKLANSATERRGTWVKPWTGLHTTPRICLQIPTFQSVLFSLKNSLQFFSPQPCVILITSWTGADERKEKSWPCFNWQISQKDVSRVRERSRAAEGRWETLAGGSPQVKLHLLSLVPCQS